VYMPVRMMALQARPGSSSNLDRNPEGFLDLEQCLRKVATQPKARLVAAIRQMVLKSPQCLTGFWASRVLTKGPRKTDRIIEREHASLRLTAACEHGLEVICPICRFEAGSRSNQREARHGSRERRHNTRMEPTPGGPLARPAGCPRSVNRSSLGAAHSERWADKDRSALYVSIHEDFAGHFPSCSVDLTFL
jgi:hypothetical protein